MSSADHDRTHSAARPRWHIWKVVVFGQLLAAILAVCGITSTALATRVRPWVYSCYKFGNCDTACYSGRPGPQALCSLLCAALLVLPACDVHIASSLLKTLLVCQRQVPLASAITQGVSPPYSCSQHLSPSDAARQSGLGVSRSSPSSTFSHADQHLVCHTPHTPGHKPHWIFTDQHSLNAPHPTAPCSSGHAVHAAASLPQPLTPAPLDTLHTAHTACHAPNPTSPDSLHPCRAYLCLPPSPPSTTSSQGQSTDPSTSDPGSPAAKPSIPSPVDLLQAGGCGPNVLRLRCWTWRPHT